MLKDKEGSRSRKEESHIKEGQRRVEVKGGPRTGGKPCKEARSEQIGRHQERFPQQMELMYFQCLMRLREIYSGFYRGFLFGSMISV